MIHHPKRHCQGRDWTDYGSFWKSLNNSRRRIISRPCNTQLESPFYATEPKMRALENDSSAQVMVDPIKLNYNFARPHMTLGGQTPAEAPGLDLHWNGKHVERPNPTSHTRESQLRKKDESRFHQQTISIIAAGKPVKSLLVFII